MHLSTAPVVETFYSIQGEGASLGRPSFFIRFAGCNLSCSFCDSKTASQEHLWQRAASALDIEVLDIPTKCNRIVFTGGEPTLQPLDAIVNQLENHFQRSFIFECESNATVRPSDSVLGKIKVWNLSPKLAGTQDNDFCEALRLKSLPWWSDYGKKPLPGAEVNFKFVVGSESQFQEVLEIIRRFALVPSQVFCMREGHERCLFLDDPFNLKLVELCKDSGINYTPRLHILLWDKATGV